MSRGSGGPRTCAPSPRPATRSPITTTRSNLDAKTTEGREVDVTFRLALIAKLLEWELDFA